MVPPRRLLVAFQATAAAAVLFVALGAGVHPHQFGGQDGLPRGGSPPDGPAVAADAVDLERGQFVGAAMVPVALLAGDLRGLDVLHVGKIGVHRLAAPQTNQVGTTTPAGVGYNNKGGIVDSNAMQGAALNQVHYHYHYDSSGQPIGNAPAGYAQEKYENPDKLSQNVNSTNSQTGAGGMYAYQDNNINPNSRVGPGGNGGGAGVNAVWNPYLNNGSGMLTYASAGGGVEGFND